MDLGAFRAISSEYFFRGVCVCVHACMHVQAWCVYAMCVHVLMCVWGADVSMCAWLCMRGVWGGGACLDSKILPLPDGFVNQGLGVRGVDTVIIIIQYGIPYYWLPRYALRSGKPSTIIVIINTVYRYLYTVLFLCWGRQCWGDSNQSPLGFDKTGRPPAKAVSSQQPTQASDLSEGGHGCGLAERIMKKTLHRYDYTGNIQSTQYFRKYEYVCT